MEQTCIAGMWYDVWMGCSILSANCCPECRVFRRPRVTRLWAETRSLSGRHGHCDTGHFFTAKQAREACHFDPADYSDNARKPKTIYVDRSQHTDIECYFAKIEPWKVFSRRCGNKHDGCPPSGSAHEVGAKNPMLPLRGPWGKEAASPAAFRAYFVP